MLIGLLDVFAFGQQKQLFQNIFDITNNPVGVEILNPQPEYQTLEVTEDIAYQQLFRLLLSFEKQAAKQTNEGYLQRAEFLRSFLQRKAGLTLEQANVLKADALNFTTQFGCRPNSDTATNQTEDYNSEKFNRERNQKLSEYRNRIRQLLGESGFDKFDKFVRENIASRIIFSEDLKTRTLLVGSSMVDYDYQSNQVIGYSYTEAEIGHCLNITNIVLATLTGNQQGEVDSDYAEICDGRAEVYLYFSDPQPQEQFCVDGEHYFAREFGLPRQSKDIGSLNNSNGKFNRGVCSPQKFEQSPSTQDCLTVPPLPNVTGVSFQQIAPINSNSIPLGENADMDNNPNTDDGQRIFPDDDSPMENANRQTIRVRASINEARSGVTVYFRNFDLDDPSDDPIIDTNDVSGDDNNGMPRPGQLSATSANTNSQGVATVNFTVTRQPGDNFAIAVSTDDDELGDVTVDGLNLSTGNGATIDTNCDGTEIVCRSRMLTVWRRLHIEVDSMGNVSGNLVSGAVPNEVRVRRNTTVTIPVYETMEPDRFQGGRFALGSASLEVTENDINSITVRNNNQPTVYAPANTQFQLYDDDNFNDSIGNLNGDTGEDIAEPPDTLLQSNDTVCSSTTTTNCNVFASSYVRPVYDITSDNSNNSIFQTNIEAIGDNDPTPVRDVFVDFDQDSTQADPEFWTIYLYGSYQQNRNSDADPADENGDGNPDGCPDTSYGVVDRIGPNGWGACVHMEVGRVREYPADYANRPVSRAWTATHEVGHLFGGIHDDDGIMTPTCTRTSYTFDPRTIRRLRATITNP